MNKKILITIAITMVISGGLGFYAGSTFGLKQENQNRPAWNNNQQGTRGTGQMGAAFSEKGNGGMVSGEILSIDNGSITVKAQNGGSKIALVSDATKITKSVSEDKNNLKVGDKISVIGKTNTDGSVSAEVIQIGSFAPSKITP